MSRLSAILIINVGIALCCEQRGENESDSVRAAGESRSAAKLLKLLKLLKLSLAGPGYHPHVKKRWVSCRMFKQILAVYGGKEKGSPIRQDQTKQVSQSRNR